MHTTSARKRTLLAFSVALSALTTAPAVWAADVAATAGPGSTTTTEGVEVSGVIVTLERDKAAAAAPTKASLDETQPESIITRKFIEEATPESGGWTTAVLIAPSVAGISANGGGIGNYNVVTMRGFQDGQFNLTYDGLSFGDTNNPTHHGSDYFPASTIGAVVVDRGPGAAGDLGQANFGGAIHYFSPDVAESFGLQQKLTYGSFNTAESVTTLNTGSIAWLGNGRFWLNLDERRSDGQLSHAGGDLFNQSLKFVLPVSDKLQVTALYEHEWTRFNFEDSSGPGETYQQTLLYGKNFSMNNDPLSEHYTGYNFEKKQTDFAYIDVKYQITPTIKLDNDMYEYFYSNKTISASDLTGATGPDQNGQGTTPNTAVVNVVNAQNGASDIGGYYKVNDYHVYGDILRVNKDWSFGTLKIGGLVEGSQTERRNILFDLTTGLPDNKYAPPKYPFTTNEKTFENSNWFQGQVFVDFDWRPIEGLNITPGFKYVNFTRTVDATHDNTTETGLSGGSKNTPLNATNTYTSPLYFLTTNYKIRKDWAVYGQFATSFLIPALSNLYTPGVNVQSLRPETTNTYQAGTVYTHGHITADADVYLIDASNLNNPCTLYDNGVPTSSYCNYGSARYSGVEGEASYHFDFGLTVFGNGSINDAKQLANAPDAAAGIVGNKAQQLANAPKWTFAGGLIYAHGPWHAAMTYKQVGSEVNYNTVSGAQYAFHIPHYDTVNATLGYDFTRRLGLKLQVFNLFDKRSLTSYTPETNATSMYTVSPSLSAATDGIYTFQSGRELQATLIARF